MWEYQIKTSRYERFAVEDLNLLGAEGWEMVSYTERCNEFLVCVAIFKRHKPKPAPVSPKPKKVKRGHDAA